jgi:hypothetical protein
MPIPVFSVTDLGARARSAYDSAGALIIRGGLSSDTVETVRRQWSEGMSIFDRKAEAFSAGTLPADDEHITLMNVFALHQFLPHLVMKYVTKSEGIAETLRPPAESIFGPISFVELKSVIRRQGKKSAYVVWHRDAHAVKTNDDGDCFNCWVPVDSVGVDRPSLQISCGSHRDWSIRPVDYASLDNPTHDEVVANYPIETAMLDPGDILIFSHFTLHRTQPMEESHGRISGEYRFAIHR